MLRGATRGRAPNQTSRAGREIVVTCAANPLMLVSASADEQVRREVAEGMRPRRECLVLEEDHGFRLLDWSHLPRWVASQNRSPLSAAAHVRAALRGLEGAPAVLSDGEHLGILLGYALRARGLHVPHVVIGHQLDSRKTRTPLRNLRAAARIDRMVVQSVRQREVAVKLGIPTQRIVVLRPAVDTEFWEPYAERTPGARAIVGSVGIEHRDYATFVEAMEGLPARLVISIGSTLSPVSHARLPAVWPHNADVSFAPASRLRLRHADATVVVVPIVETEYPAGITSVLEAMAMAKPVVVSGTRGLDDVVKDGETGLVVPPGDAAAMHRAVRRLLEDHRLRRRLGMHARAFAVAEAGLDRFAARLAGHLGELVAGDAENWLPPVALAAHVR